MLTLQDGQCGLCRHFGEGEPNRPPLVQIRTSRSAPAGMTEPCGHPRNESLRLKVTPISGCAGFAAAAA
ncbi:hypothetical protein [Phycisphaera mikurensis]|uniref:Uncharacterized protein n=1 Tax=Phycisphaera mikurensis (strain NBRC 102666 / KCTC 22515 / FYK2301M01) TaxID=1142394 RepID=I0IHN3_PHYMF|nr:hypothetical protein [Phycisphaera mikurensis]MBB6441016.1 hypothetical protein [Phycisphaera mikurensis]BAM04771.1 hypothetical protein PSMK_26120 [Phycisphaera mikurensis NBRC 102666]